MNWLRFTWRGTSNLVRRDTASIELNVLTYVYGAAARLRFYSCYVCVPCASTACNAAADAQKHECNTHVHDRTMEWFVHSWALLWICAATHRTAFVLSSPSLNIWCVLSTHESIIARIGNITNRSHAALSHCSPSRFPCHFELVWFGSLIYRRRCRLFVFVVLSLAFSWEHTFSANSCSKIEFFCWETRTKKFFYVRSFVYVAAFF